MTISGFMIVKDVVSQGYPFLEAMRTGEGQVVDVALYEPMPRLLDEMIPVHAATGYVRERIGSATEYVVAMGRPALVDTFPSMAERIRRRTELDGLVQAWVGSMEAAKALAVLEAAEVLCGLVARVKDLFEDPHVRARDNIVQMPSPLGGLLAMAGIVPRLTASPGRIERTGPVEVGAHNEEIYCGRLGLTRDELHALVARGIV